MLLAGFGYLLRYEMRAGVGAPQTGSWPQGSALPFDPSHSNLVMFSHPRCPCTRASLAELEALLAQSGCEIRATLCFLAPDDDPDWKDTPLVRKARDIPGLRVVFDRNGTLAARFGARTSGQVLVFDRAGRNVFSGGITSARGHAGDNRGSAHLLAFVRGEKTAALSTPVYGCALDDPAVVASPYR
ncbi:MAG: redB [Verrucomicrobia bacterium]|nr:redB [Verrucomicrobiota bacterium]